MAVLDLEEAQRSPLLVDGAFGLFGSQALPCRAYVENAAHNAVVADALLGIDWGR